MYPRLPLSRMMASVVSASRMSRTSTPLPSDHLTPFAMWPAFPASDYYGVSVAMGLAPGRRSRVSPLMYVLAWVRPPFVPTPGMSFPVSHRRACCEVPPRGGRTR